MMCGGSQGDHVKVVGGRKAGVTGTVVRVEGEVIYLLTDITNDEIRVFSADLQETNEVSSGLDVVGQVSKAFGAHLAARICGCGFYTRSCRSSAGLPVRQEQKFA